MNISNKVVVITGAASGIGYEVATQIIQKGGVVAAIDISNDRLTQLQHDVGSDALSIHQCDIGNESEINRVVKEILKEHTAVDVLINNAGIIQSFVTIEQLSIDHIRRVMDVNFYGTVYMTKLLLPSMKQQPQASIVNVASMGAFLPVPGQSAYGASKAAVKLFTEGLYAELRHSSVSVCIVYPGAIETSIVENSGVEAPRIAEKQQKKYKSLPAKLAARYIIEGIEKNKARIVIGSDAKFMDKLYRLSPLCATKLIAKKMDALLKT